MKKIFTALIISLLLLVTACSQNPSGQITAESVIKIGVIAPLTGEASSYGLAAKEGLDFAVKEINSKGGILGKKIQLDYEDSEFDNKKAVSIMNKFINVDNYDIVIVADGSGPTTAVAPMADQTNTLIMATLASTPQLSTMGDYVFRTVSSDTYQGTKMADFAEDKGYETAAILYANDAYGQGIRDVFKKEYSGEIISLEPFNNGDTDFKIQLAKIKDKEPELIVLAVRKELPNVLTQIKTLKIKSALLGTETTKDDELIKAAGSSAEGMYSVYYSKPTDYKGYRTKFKAEYDQEPPAYSDYSYDAVYVLSEAITKANSFESEKIKNQLYSVRFKGATGIVEFDSNGDVINKPFTFYKVIDGSFVPVISWKWKMSFFLQLLLNGIIAGSIYSLVSSGFSLIYTTNKVINFAHGAILVLSAYLAYLFFNILGFPFVLAGIFAISLIVLVGYACSKTIQKLRKNNASNAMLLLASISILILIENVLLLAFGPKTKSYALFNTTQSIELFGAIITPLEITIILASLLLLFLLYYFIQKTKTGLKIRAVADESLLSESIGISSNKLKTIALIIASIIAGIAGILVGLEFKIEPFMGTGLIIKGFTGAIIGGVTSITGAILGAFLVGITENIGIAFLPTQFKDAITFTLLFVFLLFKPKGLFGGIKWLKHT